jgi:hypothetical protein
MQSPGSQSSPQPRPQNSPSASGAVAFGTSTPTRDQRTAVADSARSELAEHRARVSVTMRDCHRATHSHPNNPPHPVSFLLQLRQLSAMLVLDDNEVQDGEGDDPAAVYESASEEAVTRVGACARRLGRSGLELEPHTLTPTPSLCVVPPDAGGRTYEPIREEALSASFDGRT